MPTVGAPTVIGAPLAYPIAHGVFGRPGPYKNGSTYWILAASEPDGVTGPNIQAFSSTDGVNYFPAVAGPRCAPFRGENEATAQCYVVYRGSGTVLDAAYQDPDTGSILTVTFDMATPAFGTPSDSGVLLAPVNLGNLVLAINGAGHQVIGWYSPTNPVFCKVNVSGTWGSPVEVDDGSNPAFFLDSCSVNGDGDVVFIFGQGSGFGLRFGQKLWAIFNGTSITSRGSMSAMTANEDLSSVTPPIYDANSDSIVQPFYRSVIVSFVATPQICLLVGTPSNAPVWSVVPIATLSIAPFGTTYRLNYITITANSAGTNFKLFWYRRDFRNYDLIDQTSSSSITSGWSSVTKYYEENTSPPTPPPRFSGMGPVYCNTLANGSIGVIAGLGVNTPAVLVSVLYTWGPSAPVTAITVTCPLGTATTGSPYSSAVTASGGTAPYTYSVSGALPPGLTLDPATGGIVGTPTLAGFYPVTYTAQDSLGAVSVPQPCGISVNGVSPGELALACPTFHDLEVGVPYVGALVASGGVPPYTFAIVAGSLPPGLTLDPSTGIISGTPTATGSYPYTAQVTDSSS